MSAVIALTETIGHEKHDETGQLSATGLFARFTALERRIGNIENDRAREQLIFKSRAAGALAVIGAVFALLVWIAGDRVENVQKIIRAPVTAEEKK